MIEFLPMFPLQLVAFPKERLNLHVFEPRYVQMMEEAEKNGTTFGIPAYLNKSVQNMGTEMCLLKIDKRYENGRMDIKTEGVRIFEIKEFFNVAPEKLYAAAHVEILEDLSQPDLRLNQKILDLISRLYEYMKINKTIPESAASFTTFDMGHHVGFSVEQEYKILTLESEVERQEFMLQHLENLLPVVKEMEELRRRVQMNGHFKDVLPPDFKR